MNDFLIFNIFICGIGLLGVIFPVATTFYVYQDAKKKDNGLEVLWTVLNIFLYPVFFIVYILVIRDYNGQKSPAYVTPDNNDKVEKKGDTSGPVERM